MKKTILVAGGTGNLGDKIVQALLKQGAEVRVLARKNSKPDTLHKLEKFGAHIYQLDMESLAEVTTACLGADCVVSALAGLSDVILGTQKVLLDAAVAAGVPRFIPSDFSIDFTKFPDGGNRNLDLRRAFHLVLDKAPIKATTIFNGAFADMLTGEMPMILFKKQRILHWGNADQAMDFTSVQSTAEYTAHAALDESAPRFLRISGDRVTPKDLASLVGNITRQEYKLFRAGGMGLLSTLIKIARTFAPGKNELYPAWQGMQYMRNMIDGRAITDLDNQRYAMEWYGIKEIVTKHHLATSGVQA